MARAPLPLSVNLRPFFVLRWNADEETMIVAVEEFPGEDFDLGDHLPAVSEQLQLWGLEKLFADRAVDSAREFGAAQAIPDQDRIINLFPREPATTLVSDMLTNAERQEGHGYAYI